MHYVDELIALFEGRDALTAKYLLSRLGGVPAGHDADTLIAFLSRQAASSEPVIARQAQLELARVLPPFVRQDYGLEGPRHGVWTAYQDQAALDRAAAQMKAAAEAKGRATPALGALAHALFPALSRALTLMAAGGASLRAAALAVGQLPLESVRTALGAGLASDRWFLSGLALASADDEPAHELLLSAVQQHARQRPDLVALLRAVPVSRTLPVLERVEQRSDAYGRVGVALALAGGEEAARGLLERVLRRAEGWPSIYALDALSAAPRPDDLGLVELAHRTERHDFVRVQAAVAAGHLRTPEAASFLLARLADGSPRVQAAALEGLARHDHDAAALAAGARRLLESSLVKARVNALLVLARLDPEAVAAPLSAMLLASEPILRLEGAHVLGYLPGQEACASLREMAAGDTAFPVQVQAIKSLARQPSAHAHAPLASLLVASDPRLAVLAAGALADLEGEPSPAAAEALARAIPAAGSPVVKAALLRSLGAVAARLPERAVPPAIEAALADASPGEVRGALEGAKYLSAAGCPVDTGGLTGHADPGVRLAAARVRFLDGDLRATRLIEQALEGDDTNAHAGLSILLELLALVPAALKAGWLPGLARSLDGVTTAPELAAFVQKEHPRPARVKAAAPVAPKSRGTQKARAVAPVPLNASQELRARYARRTRSARPGGPLARERVEEASYLASLPLGVGGVIGRLRAAGPLLAIPVALLIPFGLFVTRLTAPAEPGEGARPVAAAPVAAGALRVTHVEGQATRTPRGATAQPAAAGDLLSPGDALATAASSRAALFDRKGSSVSLGASSRLRLGVPAMDATTPAGTLFVFLDPEGDVFLDVRKAERVEILAGGGRLVLERAAARVQRNQLSVMAGRVTLLFPGAAAQHVPAGRTMPIAPPVR